MVIAWGRSAGEGVGGGEVLGGGRVWLPGSGPWPDVSVPAAGQHRTVDAVSAIERPDDEHPDHADARQPLGDPVLSSQTTRLASDSQSCGFFPQHEEVTVHHRQAGDDDRGQSQGVEGREQAVKRQDTDQPQAGQERYGAADDHRAGQLHPGGRESLGERDRDGHQRDHRQKQSQASGERLESEPGEGEGCKRDSKQGSGGGPGVPRQRAAQQYDAKAGREFQERGG